MIRCLKLTTTTTTTTILKKKKIQTNFRNAINAKLVFPYVFSIVYFYF